MNKKSNKINKPNAIMAAILLSAAATPSLALAQNAADPVESEPTVVLDEIIVTARKREERLIDAPLSIQAFSAASIEEAGIDNLEDLTQYTPGLDYKSQSSGLFAGRYLPAIRFRGLTSISNTPSSQVGSLFVDGVYVLGGAQSIGFEDINQVEVIKGPQSAYFGRSTFGGAINYTTVDPADEFAGKVTTDYSPTNDSYRGALSLEGPLIGDKLSGRLTLAKMRNGAYITASDGGELGEETTDSFHGTLLFTPSENVRIKFRGSHIEDEDGAPATGLIRFAEVGNCPIGTPLTVLDGSGARRSVTLQGPQVCGALPENVSVSSNTIFPFLPANPALGLPEADGRAIFVGNSLNLAALDEAPSFDQFGLRRKTTRLATTFEFDLSESFTLSGNVARNEQDVIRIADGDYTDNQSFFYAAPNKFEDSSAELKLAFDDGGRLRALVGANYYSQEVRGAFGNAIEATNQIDFFGLFQIRVVGTANSGNNSDEIDTTGIFGSLEYDFSDKMTLSLEGRYQSDEVTNFSGNIDTQTTEETLESNEFLPRVILSYKPTDDALVYASYSEGTLPGQFNPQFIALSDADKALVQADFPEIQDSIDAELLKNYEIGVKQSLFDGRLNYSLAAFQMEWENMKSSVAFVPPGATGFQNALISGEGEIKGIEFEANYSTGPLDLSVTANWNDAKYVDFVQSGLNSLFGLSRGEGYRIDGNTLPQTPKTSGSASASYGGTLTNDWDWFTRADVLYQGKTFTSPTNLSWVDSSVTSNLRVGVSKDNLRLEGYVNNLFDEGGWVSAAALGDLSQVPIVFGTFSTLRAASATQRRGREFGIRASFEF